MRPGGPRHGTLDPMDATAADETAPARRRPGLPLVLLGTAAAIVATDQLLKQRALDTLSGDSGPTVVVEGWLQLQLSFNSGAAFSMGTGSTWVFTIIATVVSLYILRLSLRVGSRGWALALGLLLGGALGNLMDRLFREPGFGRGHVVDYVQSLKLPWPDFPIFNLADACIVTAAFLIAALGFRGIALDGSRVVDEQSPATPGA